MTILVDASLLERIQADDVLVRMRVAKRNDEAGPDSPREPVRTTSTIALPEIETSCLSD